MNGGLGPVLGFPMRRFTWGSTFQDCILLRLSGQGGAVTYSGVGSLMEETLPTGWEGSFLPYNCCTRMVMAAFLRGVGVEMEEESAALHLWLLICQAQGLESHKVRTLCPGGFSYVAALSPSLPPAPVSIIPLQGLGTLSGRCFLCTHPASLKHYAQV